MFFGEFLGTLFGKKLFDVLIDVLHYNEYVFKLSQATLFSNWHDDVKKFDRENIVWHFGEFVKDLKFSNDVPWHIDIVENILNHLNGDQCPSLLTLCFDNLTIRTRANLIDYFIIFLNMVPLFINFGSHLDPLRCR